jgi:CRP-like cAMP-binding protein
MVQLSDAEERIVAATPLFRSLSAEDIGVLLHGCNLVTVTRSQMLFAKGDPAEVSYLVLQGRVKLVQHDESGSEAVLRIFGPGETFAEAAAFMGGRYPVSAFAIDQCRLLQLKTRTLKAEIQRRPDIALAMLASMAAHLKTLVNQIADLKLLTADQRVAWFILKRLQLSEDGQTIRFPYGRAVLASELGMSAETFSRALKRLSRFGVAITGDVVTILNPDKLARYARVN